jgi:hypothetical protein
MTIFVSRGNGKTFALRRDAKSCVSTGNCNQLKMNILNKTKTGFKTLL